MPEKAVKILITGGARSGKSAYAEARALEISSNPVYIATCEAEDDEMRARIQAHQERRGKNWSEVHAPLELANSLVQTDLGNPRLVDCLTLWANNLLFHERDWQGELQKLLKVIETQNSPLIFVTNEIGMGVVPKNPMARKFRDVAGVINQEIAKAVNEVSFVISGIPVKVK